ncbi:MAG: alpha-ketoacid dehydrogenase subunit beta [Dehalococcoidia bacterium]
MQELTYTEAVVEAIAEEMRRDPLVFIIGQTLTPFDDVYYPGISKLAREFGRERVHVTGIVERFEAGAGVGAALAGYRPIVDLATSSFASLAYDEVFAKAGLWRYEHGGNGDMRLPVVFRMSFSSYGSGGAEHVRARTADYMHGVGLMVVVPSNPYDAKGLMKTAIRDDNPVVFMDHSNLFQEMAAIPDEEYLVPFGEAVVLREGDACTIVATGYQVKLSLQAAEQLQREGTPVEVIDLRTLIPLDLDTVLVSVRKTGRLVVVDEDVIRCGVGAEIGFQVQEALFGALKAPIQRVGNPNLPTPASPKLIRAVMPSPEKIVAAVRKTLASVRA